MRRALVAAVAAAPLLTALGSYAWAACPAAGTTTASAGNISIDSGCTVKPAAGGAGVVLNSNNTVTVASGGSISNTDVSNSTGILVQGGDTGAVTNDGSISLGMSYTAKVEGNTGVLGGAFATGSDRIGIDVIGPGAFDGSITNATGASITVDGDNSAGISIQTGITGSLENSGTITLLGNHTVAIDVGGEIGGNLTVDGTVSSTGVGASSLVTTAPVDGQISIDATISNTGYRATTAPTNSAVLSQLGADQLGQGGPAISIGGNVAGGIDIAASTTSGNTTTPAATILQFGSAPALLIGAGNQSITIGDNAADPFGLVVGGTVSASGLYSQKTSPNLAAPANATAIELGSATAVGEGGLVFLESGPGGSAQIVGGAAAGDVGTLSLTDGVHVTGAVVAAAVDAQAIALDIAAGTTAPTIVNDNSISAGVTAQTPNGVAIGILIHPGAVVHTITNNGLISGAVQDSIQTTAQAGAIVDASGSVQEIDNTGQITASLIPTNTTFVLGGPVVAIDVSQSTTGTVINQTQSTSFHGQAQADFKGSISGNTLTVTDVIAGNIAVGETIRGPGIPAGTTITANGTGSGGKGTYTLSTTSTVSSEELTAAGAPPSITGDIIFGKGANVLNVQDGTTSGGVFEQAGERNLVLNVATDAGTTAAVDITKASTHQVTTLDVGAGGTLIATVDPSFAQSVDNIPVFDTTVHAGQAGPDGTATFASGAQIGVRLASLQADPVDTYTFVHTSGPGALTVGNLSNVTLINAPFLFQATTEVEGGDLDVVIQRKSAQQLGLNAAGAAAFDAVFAALLKDQKLGDALIAPTTQVGFLQLYNQMIPDQGIGTFDALEAATEKIANLTEQAPDAGTRVGGSSLWLQEVNERIKRNDGETIGSSDKAFGLVGGLEKMGAGGGALGLTVAYLNIQDNGNAAPINAHIVTDLAEVGAYYRRAWGGIRFSVRGAAGYAWFNEKRQFLTTGVSETSNGSWNAFFGDGHAGAEYEWHISRFYLRPELSADYLYLNEAAHRDTGAGPGFDLAFRQRTSDRMSGAAVLTFGAQYGHDVWFRPEVYGGYRQVFFGNIGNTVANFTGGLPFTLVPGNVNGGWITAGFALKGGTPLSYVSIEGEADLRNNEQRYSIYLSGRAMF